MRHIIESQQFDREFIRHIFRKADQLHKEMHLGGHKNWHQGRIMATLFYEPSTRTRLSFEAAMLRLGGQVITTENAGEFSSAAKGESLEDTIRVVGGYADVIVLRHKEVGASERARTVSRVPIINAGDGNGQHPTQALLDLYTIHREKNALSGISIAMVGDLRYGRTIRSLAYLLGKYENTRIAFVAPPELQITEDITEYLDRHTVPYRKVETLAEVLADVDVIYQTRLQTERLPRGVLLDPAYRGDRLRKLYTINARMLEQMRTDTIIMHPLPRNEEIAVEVDSDPRAVYFKQAEYGLFVRMALLHHVLSE